MEPRDRAIVMLNRGVLRLEHRTSRTRYDDLTRSAAYAGQAGDTRLESMARHNLGYVDFLAGRIPRAISAYRQAAATWPEAPHPAMQLDLARGLREAGLLADADEVLVQVMRAGARGPAVPGPRRDRAGPRRVRPGARRRGRARAQAIGGPTPVRAAGQPALAAQGGAAGAAQRARGAR